MKKRYIIRPPRIILLLSLVIMSVSTPFSYAAIDYNNITIEAPVLATTDISNRFTDSDFRKLVWEWLGNSGAPGSITIRDIGNRLPAQGYTLSVRGDEFTSLAGLQYFEGLKKLYCFECQLTSLPSLPTTLETLVCYRNQLTSLPTLPSSLKTLDCFSNRLSSLPALPNGLGYLDCYDNKLSLLPNIPDTLTNLLCAKNQLLALPYIHKGLISLDCADNQLTTLPGLPNTIVRLNCGNNMLQYLPVLAITLKHLECQNNQLRSLPTLPMNLETLKCQYNQLSTLPTLPNSLVDLDCSYNYMDVFSDPIKARIANSPAINKKSVPQCRLSYIGSAIGLVQGETIQQFTNLMKFQETSNNKVWMTGRNADMSQLTFTSSNRLVATVDSLGRITGQGEGTCSIFALLNGKDSMFTKTVTTVTVSKTAGGSNSLPGKLPGDTTIPQITVPDTITIPGETTPDDVLPDSTEPQQEQGEMDTTSASSWAVEELEEAEQYGLVTEKVKQSLKQDITREEFCGIAVKLYEALSGKQALPAIANPFNDTSDLDILKAYELGIVKGVSSVKFAPGNNITRQEICVMIYRALKASKPNLDYSVTGVEAFQDEAQIASWAINEVRYASKNNIMKGTGGNSISPLNKTSREQGIVLVKRTYEGFEGNH